MSRLDQVNETIQKELSNIILREAELPQGSLVTITKVKTSPDLRKARVFISVYPFNKRHHIIKILQSKSHDFQNLLNDSVVLKYIPKLHFMFDKTEEQASKIDEIFEEIKDDLK